VSTLQPTCRAVSPASLVIAVALSVGSLAAAPAEVVYLETDEGVTIHWAVDEVAFELVTEGLPFDDATTEAALVSAARTWDAVTSPTLAVTYRGRRATGNPGYRSDGPNQNLVVFQRDGWAVGDESLAVTLSTYEQTSGKLLDTDILVNTSDAKWTVVATEGGYDLESTLLHEIGHALGLGHQDGAPSVMATSLDSGADRRTLFDADRDAVQALYAIDDGPAAPVADLGALSPDALARAEADVDIEYPGGRGLVPSCTTGQSAAGGWWFVAVAALLLRRRRVATVVAAAGLALTPAAASASTVLAMDIDTLVQSSTLVLQGTVRETQSAWQDGMIVTTATLETDACLSGDCPATVDLTLLGGRVGELVQVIAGAPDVRPGLEVLVFLRPRAEQWEPIGLGQGMFYIDRDAGLAIPATHGLRLLDPVIGVAREADASPITLSSLLERIAQVPSLPESFR
jgi:MYXO-CTERM domain-containing protein